MSNKLSPMYDIDALPAAIRLGNEGEQNHLTLRFDIRSWLADWPSGVIGVRFYFIPDAKYYPVPGAYVNSGILYVPVHGGMTYVPLPQTSTLLITLSDYSVSTNPALGVEKKSALITTTVATSPTRNPDEMPDMVSDWVTLAGETLALLPPALQDASDAARDANSAAQRANASADEAEQVGEDLYNSEIVGGARSDDDLIFTRRDASALPVFGVFEPVREATERANAAADRFDGIALEIDVRDRTLNLYSIGMFSALDIVLNGRSLEVYQV